MNLCTVGIVFTYAVFPTLVKQMFKAGDETKHMLLFIFHTLYTCLTVEDLHNTERERKTVDMDLM